MADKTSFGTVFLLWAVGLGAAAQFAKISIIYPELTEIYADAGASVGFIVSLVGVVGIIFGVVAGLLVARVGYRRSILLALALGGAMSIYQATLPTLPLFLASRVIEGLSHLAIVVAAPTMIAQLSAPHHQGFTLTLWSTFFGVAYAVLAFLGLPLMNAYGIGALLLAHGIYVLAMAAICTSVLPQLMHRGNGHIGSLSQIINDHIAIYRSPYQNAAALGWVCYTMTFVAILTILPSFMPEDQRAMVVGVMPLVSIAAAMLISVPLLTRLPAVRVVQLGFALSMATVIAMAVGTLSMTLCLLLAAALGLVQSASFALVPQINDGPEARARANGAMAQMGNVGTTFGTPILATMTMQFGQIGLTLFVCVLFSLGIFLHWIMERKRTAECS